VRHSAYTEPALCRQFTNVSLFLSIKTIRLNAGRHLQWEVSKTEPSFNSEFPGNWGKKQPYGDIDVLLKYKRKHTSSSVEPNTFLEMNSKVHLSLGGLGHTMDVFRWKFCNNHGNVYFDVCVIKLYYKIWSQNTRLWFSKDCSPGSQDNEISNVMFSEDLFQQFSLFVVTRTLLSYPFIPVFSGFPWGTHLTQR
jgi:hypothetical protein